MQHSNISFLPEGDAAKVFDLGRSTFRERIREERMPPPVKFGNRSLWPRHELDIVANAIIAGQSDDEIRALVATLVADRRRAAA